MANRPVTPVDLLRDAFDRVHEELPSTVADLSVDELLWQPAPGANPIGWLAWHLSRVQDDHLAELAGVEQVWTSEGWADRFSLPYETGEIGYGQSPDQVAAFTLPDPGLLTGYHSAVHELTLSVLEGEEERGLGRVVDDRWDPPVTAAARLVSVVNDTTQHLGQAAYVRGLVEHRRVSASGS